MRALSGPGMLQRALDSRVREVLPEPTVLEPARNLSARLGHLVLLKREDLTSVFSFKLRGAYNRMSAMSAAELERGVVAASAGNHAQGVAYAARKLGTVARIVMPRTTPSIKVAAVERLGAAVELVGDSYSDAAERCTQLASETGMLLIPPYDDPLIIAGQATIGVELLQQAPYDFGSVFVPIGGGGLAAGIAAVIKEVRPAVRVIGVQAEDSDAMRRSIAEGRRVRLDKVGIFADGVAVKQVGALTLELCARTLDQIVTVDTDQICAAIKDVFEDTRSVLEPAGALSIAGLKQLHACQGLPAGAAIAVASGANISFTRIGYVTERAVVGEQREALFAVTIPERPGAFRAFCGVLGERGITEFNYRLGSRDAAHIFVGVEVAGRAEAREVAAQLESHGYACVDLSADELAKSHVRHMVGGRSAEARDEVLYTFDFPERPGALPEFLTSLGGRWNISLFHYRNHGAAFGRVLCGMEVPLPERPLLTAQLATLALHHEEVTREPAARFLLGGWDGSGAQGAAPLRAAPAE